MKISYKNSLFSTDALVIGFNVKDFSSIDSLCLDENIKSTLIKLKKDNSLPRKSNQIREFYDFNNSNIILIAYEPTKKGLSLASKKIIKYLREFDYKSAAINLVDQDISSISLKVKAKILAQNILDADYTYDNHKSNKTNKSYIDIAILGKGVNEKEISQGIKEGVAIASGMNTLKDLGNAPGNECTPTYLADYAINLGNEFHSLSVEVLSQNEIEELKMGALLSVSKGSVEPPKLIKIEYNKGSGDPIVLVGKGVTFDTGGISLKPGAGMDEMKYDMCGAGSVIGTMHSLAMLDLPINVIGIIPPVENMPSGCATKPGDIVTSMSGKTIEVLNTDAEGRMILCDALTYAQQFKPRALIDIATLTGAIIVGLGSHATGLMSNDDELSANLLDAGQESGDRAWRLPIWEEYAEQMKSPFADLQNIGSKGAGSITAGCFLGEFTKGTSWAHLDIAGTAWQNRKEGATGRPVPMLVEYLISQV